MADVFISFAPEDRAWAGTFAGALTAAGFDVLWDLAPGLGQAQRDVEEELDLRQSDHHRLVQRLPEFQLGARCRPGGL